MALFHIQRTPFNVFARSHFQLGPAITQFQRKFQEINVFLRLDSEFTADHCCNHCLHFAHFTVLRCSLRLWEITKYPFGWQISFNVQFIINFIACTSELRGMTTHTGIVCLVELLPMAVSGNCIMKMKSNFFIFVQIPFQINFSIRNFCRCYALECGMRSNFNQIHLFWKI